MGQSLVKNYMHLVFSTKNRQPLIFPPIEERLHQYLGGICNDLNSQVLQVGGYHDHVHILCNVSKTISVSKLVQEIKGRSSIWIKKESPVTEHFYWQNGYGAFSVGRSELDRTVLYIQNQKTHHGLIGYQDEMRTILRAYDLEWDERYYWD